MNDSTIIRVFKYRLYPNQAQAKNRWRVLDCARNLYNMALVERKYGYQFEKRTVKLSDLE